MQDGIFYSPESSFAYELPCTKVINTINICLFITEEKETIFVDNSTGEIISQKTDKSYTYQQEPHYVKLYVKDIMYLSDIPTSLTGLTLALLKRVSYAGEDAGMCISLVPMTKKSICKELGWDKVQTLDNALQKLIKGKVIERVDRGVYRMNPYLFGCGRWSQVSKLRLEVNYDDINGRTIKGNIG